VNRDNVFTNIDTKLELSPASSDYTERKMDESSVNCILVLLFGHL
jgi:hypothetical protein